MKNKNTDKDNDQLNGFIDGELTEKQRESLLTRIETESDLRDELYSLQHVKDLIQFSYPIRSNNEHEKTNNDKYPGSMVASLLFVLSLGFLGGYFVFGQKVVADNQQEFSLADGSIQLSSDQLVRENIENTNQEKVIVYLGSSKKEKFDEALDKAESLLTKYKNESTKVYVVTSAGGLDLLKSSNTDASKNRIKKMSSLYQGLRFVACNNQIYHLHEQGESVDLIHEAEVAPSAVNFVVEHLKKGWKFIAI